MNITKELLTEIITSVFTDGYNTGFGDAQIAYNDDLDLNPNDADLTGNIEIETKIAWQRIEDEQNFITR